jgi:hypothetical protein
MRRHDVQMVQKQGNAYFM